MTLRVVRYASVTEANHLMNGGIIGGSALMFPAGNLVGKTISFTSPNGSCTFTQPSGSLPGIMSYLDVKTQLEAQVTNLKVLMVEGKLALKHATAGSVVTLANAVEPGRAILGFSKGAGTTGEQLNGQDAASAPRVIDMQPGDGGSIVILIDDSTPPS